ncbi:carboxypeptidase-like regulatory domain-containing protein [Ancylomarina euxinus]|uniref:Carboxypeptidase-like regulatory domain-containing protein n=1 Tax=Ancylomarina euxinus TaxID=2283627 RepID=A0A425Y8Z2_9BACT|nr:DUF5686 and carboxypeptidase-like regulatory domain-containing protein [Ancylomarina euxinus]MCZ4693322.1 DUF5686 family protein [Ancylomarina euxinus]MUP13550.1 carboxypeptidase-like regulatory domain-containing protein [Ancylomarina euxinus]RRG24802.1 carboxypeptidase-like regulatory domain-containing protein [Ancylomarina euxinus]
MRKLSKGLVLLLFILMGVGISQPVFAQVTKLRGKVIDADTQEPLPFVNIAFKGTTIGTTTDFDGNYFLETRTPTDSLHISFVGYKGRAFKVLKGTFQTLDIELHSEAVSLQEIRILPGENPAHILLRKIIARKKKNNPSRLESYQYETYTKMEMDLNNIGEDFKNKKIMRQFQFVFDYVDTSVVTGKSYLPVFITESLSDYYYRKSPKLEREVIKASQMSGIEDNASLAQFTGQLHQNINIYDNFIDLFNKGFVSPIADGGLSYYKYYLTDSAYRDGNWSYHMSFKPKRKLDPCFVGDFWVADTTFAIDIMKMRITKDVNLNWVKDLVSTNEYQKLNDSTWFLKKQNLFVDFMLTDRDSTSQMGFFGRKTISYRDVKLNVPIRKEIVKLENNVIVNDDALGKEATYWDNARPFKLSKRESGIYAMVDSIQNVPLYRNIIDIIQTFVTGYYTKGNFEYGPYYKLYSFNEIEGNRFMFGGRTSNDFSTKVMYNAHLAYGDKDNRLKYGLGFLYMINKLPRETFGMQWKHDIHQLGKSPNAFTEGNILASLLKRNPNNKLTMLNQFEAHYEKEWFQGFMNTLKFRYRDISPTPIVPFVSPNGDLPIAGIKASEIELRTRWTRNEKVVMGEFERVHFGGPVPIVNLYLTMGVKNLLGSNHEYFKADLSVDHTLELQPLGKLRYLATASKLFGKVPYPLLSLHEGNETYAFDPYAFNMMNYFEFASDQYVSLSLEHHFHGFILNRIPLFKKLKWRSVVTAKGLWGTLSDKNNGALTNSEAKMIFPAGLSDVKDPYFEASVGIENIFKFFRVDAMWRLNHLEPNPNQDFEEFGIRAMFQMTF